MSPRRDAIVIGGGPAGAAAATHLARAGREILLIEREPAAHDKVCGEFLSVEATVLMRALDIDPLRLGAVAIDHVRLCRGDRVSETNLPFPAMGLSRRRLDEALIARAADTGATVRRGERVIGLTRAGNAWSVRTDAGRCESARNVFLATGKRELRGHRRPAGGQDDLIGLKMHWRRDDARDDRDGSARVDLFLFPGGYGGLDTVEDGALNLCLLVRRSEFARLGKRWDGVLASVMRCCPTVAAALDGAVPCWKRPLAVASIPYGHVDRTKGADGLYRLGDQFAVIPSFSGDGIAIALHSARCAAEALLAGDGPARYADGLRHDLVRQVRFATLLSQAAVTSVGQWASARLFGWSPSALATVARATRLPGYA